MASLPLVYVHGAGRQPSPAALKRQLDGILFGTDMPTTRVAYYADVRWGPAGASAAAAGSAAAAAAPDSTAAAAPADTARRRRAIRAATSNEMTPAEAADMIVSATLAPPPSRARGRAAASVAAAAMATPGDTADAKRLARQLYRNADRVAARSAVPDPGLALGITFFDPIFRLVVGVFASDVIDYLYRGYAEAMREPVRQALLQDPPPRVIVAHSLGTIVLYDVLSEPECAGLPVELLVTVGCPLGIGNVQDRLRDGAGRPNPVPRELAAWSNYADRFDPVAIDQTVRDDFQPPFAVDAEVNNAAPNNHDLTGYLRVAMVRDRIVGISGQ